jgi:hypothetical protein
MLPFPSASDQFQQQMRGRLGFGPSSQSPAGPNGSTGPYGGGSSTGMTEGSRGGFGPANSPMGPYGGGSSTGPMQPRIMNPQGQLNPNTGVVGPRPGPFGTTSAGSDSSYHAPAMGMPPVNHGPVGPNGPGGPYGGGSSTGPVESSTGNNSVQGGWNLGGSFNPGAPTAPQPLLNLSSLNNPVAGGSVWDYGAQRNTAINGFTANPYGGNGQTIARAPGYFGGIYQANGTNGQSNPDGSGVSYLPQGLGYGGNIAPGQQQTYMGGAYGGPGLGGQAPQMMPDMFANMNYNLPVYGNVAPYPGA